MGHPFLGNGHGNGQFSLNENFTETLEERSEPQPVIINQNSAFNVFMMGTGHATLNFGSYTHPAAQGQMEPINGFPWGTVGMSTPPQQSQEPSFSATETTLPLSKAIEGLRKNHLNPGAAIHPSKLGTQGQVHGRFVSMSPSFTHSPPNGTSPQDLRKSPGSGSDSPSPADIFAISP